MTVIALRWAATVTLVGCALAGCDKVARPAAPEIPAGGVTEWVDTVHGRLKTRVYATETVGDSPILLIVLHGDIPNPPPTYHYFAQAVAEGYDAVAAMPEPVRARLGEPLPYADIVAASILRPGYTDEEGDRSDGDMGYAVTDNFTAEVVDAVAEVIAHLQAEYGARTVILAGHSGGAAISANVLGRHPDLADAALLVACGCDPDAFYARRRLTDPDPFWNQPNPSLRPLVLAADVPNATRVRMVVGDQDELLPMTQAYAEALRAHGGDVTVLVAEGLGHNIMFTNSVFETLSALLDEMGAPKEP
jgi:pimeloyl-ACP methyl ester carboxylesterase